MVVNDPHRDIGYGEDLPNLIPSTEKGKLTANSLPIQLF